MNPFNLDGDLVYLNHAAVAPWPVRTVEAVKRFAQENGSSGATHYLSWLETEQALRVQLASLIGASVDEIALLKNTSEGLSAIAYGLDWQAGENIVSIAQEFPSNRIVWESLQTRGVKLKLVDLTTADSPEQSLINLCDQNTRLLSVSSVQYATGLKLDLPRLGRHCRTQGILFCVDAIQTLGAMPFDVKESLPDFVVADGHKWMLGPEGIALFYCRKEIRDRIRLNQYGWHMVEHAGDFDRQEWELARSARRFECGSPNMLGVHALQASLGVIQDQGLESIQSRIETLTRLITEKVEASGFELLSPRQPTRRGGILTFRVPERDNQALYRSLMERHVICAYRGGGIRFSPHFHNTPEEIDLAFARLTQLV
jgi:selenocysteine lyase/cysteine desulfurase